MLSGGKSIEDIAATLGISLDTMRTHLKNIYSKIGTNRQAQLVALDRHQRRWLMPGAEFGVSVAVRSRVGAPALDKGQDAMIKLLMARLDGSAADDVRLSAAAELADMFMADIVGLFLNIVPEEKPGFGDETVKALKSRASRMKKTPLEIRRIDVSAEELSAVAVREARAADTFISLAWATRARPRSRSHCFGASFSNRGAMSSSWPSRRRSSVISITSWLPGTAVGMRRVP